MKIPTMPKDERKHIAHVTFDAIAKKWHVNCLLCDWPTRTVEGDRDDAFAVANNHERLNDEEESC